MHSQLTTRYIVTMYNYVYIIFRCIVKQSKNYYYLWIYKHLRFDQTNVSSFRLSSQNILQELGKNISPYEDSHHQLQQRSIVTYVRALHTVSKYLIMSCFYLWTFDLFLTFQELFIQIFRRPHRTFLKDFGYSWFASVISKELRFKFSNNYIHNFLLFVHTVIVWWNLKFVVSTTLR